MTDNNLQPQETPATHPQPAFSEHRMHHKTTGQSAYLLDVLGKTSITTVYALFVLGLLTVSSMSSLSASSGRNQSSLEQSPGVTHKEFTNETSGSKTGEPYMENPVTNGSTMTSSPDVSNESRTTVTVNGRTVEVPDGESYQRSYSSITDSGSTQVNISVDNNSSLSGPDKPPTRSNVRLYHESSRPLRE